MEELNQPSERPTIAVDVDSNKTGMRILLDAKVGVGSDLSLVLDEEGQPYNAKGKVIWRAGDVVDGIVKKTVLVDDVPVEQDLGHRTLADCYGDEAIYYEYAIVVKLYQPIPQEVVDRLPPFFGSS